RPWLERIMVAPHRNAIQNLSEKGIEIDEKLHVLSAVESIFFDMKIAGIAALLIGFPYLLWHLWQFIAVGLYERERKIISRYFPMGVAFGVGGAAFGYFVLIPTVLQFLYEMVNRDLMEPTFRLADYFSLFLMLTFSLALIFQLPLLLKGLGSAGLITSGILTRYRRHFILGAFVIGAMLTPPEPVSQFMMAVPTILLFELGVFLVRLEDRARARAKR
ncbi:MAG: twin-arginine translocase subunit TatC, partial [Planctomycetes bacterium]|nr:twin-arginine translocase subunit TatC [Planctomycetota bacterium]